MHSHLEFCLQSKLSTYPASVGSKCWCHLQVQDQNVDVIYRKLLSKACMSGKGGVVHMLDGSAWAFFKSLAPKLLVIGWLIPVGSWILLLQWTRQDPVQSKERKNKKTEHYSILALIFLPVEDVHVENVADVPEHPSVSSHTGEASAGAGILLLPCRACGTWTSRTRNMSKDQGIASWHTNRARNSLASDCPGWKHY